MLKNYKSNDKVKTCIYIERGLAFEPDGINLCCEPTFKSPLLFTAKEIYSGVATYDNIREKRIDLFCKLNNGDKKAGACLNCNAVYETEFKNVNFDCIGGTTINIQHFTKCNMRCKYCIFAQRKYFHPPLYSTNNIIDIFHEYVVRNKVVGRCWITANGGEPSILKGYGNFCEALARMDIADVCVFSNCIKYDAKIAELLGKDDIFLTVSFDSGTPSTFAEVRGVPAIWKVVDTLVRYRKTGTHRLWLKYIITEDNCNDDDLFGFVFFMTSLKPDKVYICPEFPYGDRETPYKFVVFGARMWYLLKKYADINIHIQTDDDISDPKFKKYSKNIREEFDKLAKSTEMDGTYCLAVSTERMVDKVNSSLMEEREGIINRYKRARVNKRIYKKIIDKLYQLLFYNKYIKKYIIESLMFDDVFYRLHNNCDVCNNSFDSVEHYCVYGWREGKNPNDWFDTNAYLKANPDVNINPFYHYLRYGISEGRPLR